MEYIIGLGGFAAVLIGIYFFIPQRGRKLFLGLALVNFAVVLYWQILSQPYRVSRILFDLGLL